MSLPPFIDFLDFDFNDFVNYITDKSILLNVLENIKLDVRKYKNIIILLKPIVKKFNITKRSDILFSSLSKHTFCPCLFKQSNSIIRWIEINSELFDTDIYFYFLIFYIFELENDIPTFPIYYDVIPMFDSPFDINIIVFNSVIDNYYYLGSYINKNIK